MKRRIFAAVLAAAMLLSLAACGGGGTSSSNPGSAGGSGASSSQPDASNPDGSQPDASAPDASSPDGSQPDGSGSASGGASSGVEVTLTLNRTNIELNKAGATFRLRYTADPDTDGIASFASSDTKVATVAEDGTVKAVAPGKATITVTYDGATATASVNCNWKDSQPAPAPDASKPSGGSSSSTPELAPPDTATQVDLQKFYNDIVGTDGAAGKYQFSFMDAVGDEILDQRYAGLTGLSLSQRLVYMCGMSPSPNGDFALIQVSDSKDVDTVKSILQARIDYMVGDGNGPGGAFYPMEQTIWEENARIAVNGSYVMLIVHENCDDIVNDFNALF